MGDKRGSAATTDKAAKRRKGGHRPKGHQRASDLRRGDKGLLVSCESHLEAKAEKELNIILQRIVPKCVPLVQSDSDQPPAENTVVDFEKELQQEASALCVETKPIFTICQSGCKGLLFVRLRSDVDPLSIANEVCEEMRKKDGLRSRYIFKLSPVFVTCYPSKDDIAKEALSLIDASFSGKSEGETFAIVYRGRNNSEVRRDDIITSVASLVGERAKVDLSTPKTTIMVDVIKSVCCIGVSNLYPHNKKYNLRAIMQEVQGEEDDK